MLFDLIGGLPLHPLLVHAAVILLPVMGVVTPLVVAVPRWRPRLPWVVAADLGTAVAMVATVQSGEALQSRLSQVAGFTVARGHGDAGRILAGIGLLLFLLAAASLFAVRRGGLLIPVAVVLLSALGAVGVGLTVVVGHSGATASWQERIAGTPPPLGG